jgi:signal transduction histidine kinase
VRITVVDDGAGLSPAQVVDICKEGVQFNVNELQAGGGSGLGLFIGKGIVEQHGGTIQVSSDGLGRGATFVIELPMFRVGLCCAPL